MPKQMSFDLFHRFERLTVNDAVQVYWLLEGKFLRGHSNRRDLDRFAESPYGNLSLDVLSTVDLKTYRASRKIQNEALRGSTINKEMGRIKRFINAFYEWRRVGRVGGYDFSGLILPAENPGTDIKREDETRYRRKLVLTPEQFTRFCDYAHPETRKIATVALLTLLRRRDLELLGQDNLNRAFDVLSGTQAKTGQPYSVPASLTVKVLFAKAEHTFVLDFTGHKQRWRRACSDSGIWFQLRDLRRTGATHLLLEGIDIVTVQRLLGHSGIKMTMNYLDPPAPIAKEAAKALEKKFVTLVTVPVYDWQEN